jgi:hypothetical protein
MGPHPHRASADKFVKIVETPLREHSQTRQRPRPTGLPRGTSRASWTAWKRRGFSFRRTGLDVLVGAAGQAIRDLVGISGTGRRSWLWPSRRRFSPQASQRPDAVEDAEVVSENPTYRIIAVRPDWTDGRVPPLAPRRAADSAKESPDTPL